VLATLLSTLKTPSFKSGIARKTKGRFCVVDLRGGIEAPKVKPEQYRHKWWLSGSNDKCDIDVQSLYAWFEYLFMRY